MFERYTEKARRIIFFARYEASQYGSKFIETEHLLLGLLREDKALAEAVLKSQTAIDSIRALIEAHTKKRSAISTSVDLPLSNESKRVLAFAAEEADRLNHRHIGPPHLLLGMLRETKCFAACILLERQVDPAAVRAYAAGSFHDTPQPPARIEPPPALLTILAEHENAGLIAYAQNAVFTGRHADFLICAPPDAPDSTPQLCILLLQGESLTALRARIESFLTAGVPQVWLLDPADKRAYTATPAEGLRESTTGILRISHPAIELNVAALFA